MRKFELTKFKFLIILFVFILNMADAKLPLLSQNAKIQLFTCSPGQELYAGFGHSALWVTDPVYGIDRLYNYGTFDFNTPNFYWKFIRGKLNYLLSVTTGQRFIDEYDYRKIEVYGQVLNLTIEEKQKLFEALEINLLPENRFYKYDFFYDNCATRIRDVVEKATDKKLTYNIENKNITFRSMLFPYLKHTPWTKFGINLILGYESDKIATPRDYMFLPEQMQIAFNNTIINDQNAERPLVSIERQYLKNRLHFSNKKIDDPIVIFSTLLLFSLLLIYVELKRKKVFHTFNIVLFSISAFAGFFLLFMWLGTDHIATNKNMNILWLLPGQLIFIVGSFMKSSKINWYKWAFYYQLLATVSIPLWPQASEISFIFISLLFVSRIGTYLFQNKAIRIMNP
jgi:hypothetical protein